MGGGQAKNARAMALGAKGLKGEIRNVTSIFLDFSISHQQDAHIELSDARRPKSMPEMDSPRNSDPRTVYRVIFLMPGWQNMGCWVPSTKHEFLSGFCTRPLGAQPPRLKSDQNSRGSLGGDADFSQLRLRIFGLNSALKRSRSLL